MLKKELFIPLILAGLSLIFFIVCFLVFITRGNNSYFIKKKLKVGAMILALTAIVYPESYSYAQTIKCYVKPPSNVFFLDQNKTEINIDLSKSNILAGKINFRKGTVFSYKVTDEKDNVKQVDNIKALDDKFDEFEEAFQIKVSDYLPSGKYYIYFYSLKKEDQNAENTNYSYKYTLNIKNNIPVKTCYIVMPVSPIPSKKNK